MDGALTRPAAGRRAAACRRRRQALHLTAHISGFTVFLHGRCTLYVCPPCVGNGLPPPLPRGRSRIVWFAGNISFCLFYLMVANPQVPQQKQTKCMLYFLVVSFPQTWCWEHLITSVVSLTLLGFIRFQVKYTDREYWKRILLYRASVSFNFA